MGGVKLQKDIIIRVQNKVRLKVHGSWLSEPLLVKCNCNERSHGIGKSPPNGICKEGV